MLIKKYRFKLFKLRPKSNTRKSGKVLKNATEMYENKLLHSIIHPCNDTACINITYKCILV